MNQVATAKPRPQPVEVADLRRQLTTMEGEFEAVLPRGVRVDEFKRVVLNAVQERPELLAADQPSFFRSCLDCARDGLVPDGKEAYFDIRNTKVKIRGQGEVWIQKVVYMPMVRGFYKRAVGPGKALRDWRADVIREGDEYLLEKGDNERFFHKPDIFGDNQGKIIGAYSIAVYHDGSISRAFMSRADLMKAKAASSSSGSSASPWNTWEDQMCIKTVVKRHGKRLPLGEEAEALIERDNEAQTIEAAPAPARAAIAGSKATAKLAAIAKPAQEPQEAEEDDGDQQEPEVQQPAQRAQEAAQQPGKRGPGRPTNEERQAAQQASQEALQEALERKPYLDDKAKAEVAKRAAASSTGASKSAVKPAAVAAPKAAPKEPEKTTQQQADDDQAANEDAQAPRQVAYQQGWAAFNAELDRKPPRALTAANRYDELDGWYEGYDAAAESAEKGELAEADEFVDRAFS